MAGVCLRTGRRPRGRLVCKRGEIDPDSASIRGAAERRLEGHAGLLKRGVTTHMLHMVHGPGLDCLE